MGNQFLLQDCEFWLNRNPSIRGQHYSRQDFWVYDPDPILDWSLNHIVVRCMAGQ